MPNLYFHMTKYCILKKVNQAQKQRIRCRYNFHKIVCILPEDGSTELKHVAIKITSSNKG
jgi:hypothetical protein